MLHAYHRLPRVIHARRTVQRRGYLTEAFCELATALPYPPSWPAYSTTIIIGTVVARLGILPVTLWANQRMIRYHQYVEPALLQIRPRVQREVLEQLRAEGFKGDKEAWKKLFIERASPVLKEHQKALCIEHKCRSLPTTIVPAVVQMALFIPSSYLLTQCALDPFSGFDSESFMSLTSLAHPDESLAFPIGLGLITLANVESSTWFMSNKERETLRVNEEKAKVEVAKGVRTIKPAHYIKSGLRFISVARIVIASQVSGAVALYWTVSAAFGLVQTWWMEHSRKKAIDQLYVPPAPSPVLTPAKSAKNRSKVKSPRP